MRLVGADCPTAPHIKPGTAVVLIGKRGAGKSFFGKKLEKLLGDKLFFSTAKRSDLFGNWNDHLEFALVVQLEEAIWAGNHQEMSELNEEVTGAKTAIRTRFQSTRLADNIRRFILNANPGDDGDPGWSIPAAFDERRYTALYVSDAQANQKKEYFDPIDDQLDNHEGYEALMYFLGRFPFHKYVLTKGLETEALMDQKTKTATQNKTVKGSWIKYVQVGDLPWVEVVDADDVSVTTPPLKMDKDGKIMGGEASGSFIEDPFGEYYYVGKVKLRQAYAKSIGKKVEEIDEVAFGLAFNNLFPELDERGNIVMINKGRAIKTVLRKENWRDENGSKMNIYIIPELAVVRALIDKVVKFHIEWNEINDWQKKEYD